MRVLGILLMVIGALVGGSGGYVAATYVQPGDWVVGRAGVANPGGEPVVVSLYGLLSFDTDLRVSATSDKGDVFVGAANPIDVDDYTAGVKHATLTSLSLNGLTAKSDPGTSDLPAAANNLDFWVAHASGASEQSVIIPGQGDPAQAVIIGTGTITARVDYRIPGAYPLVIAAIALGAILFLFGLFLLLRKNRRGPTPAAAETPAAQTAAPPATTPGPLPPAARLIAGLVALSLVASVSGCSVPRIPAPRKVPDRAAVTKVPLTSQQAVALGADYSARNNVALTQSAAPTFDEKVWDNVDSEVLLESDRFSTAYVKFSNDSSAPTSCTTTVEQVYPSLSSAYPLSAIVSARWDCGSDPGVNFNVFTKEHTYSPWRLGAQVHVASMTGLDPTTALPTSDDVLIGTAAANDLLGYINTGEAGSVKVADFENLRQSQLEETSYSTSSITAAILETASGPAIRTVKAGTGLVTLVTYREVVTQAAKPGSYVSWSDPYDKVYNQAGRRQTLVRPYGVVVALRTEAGSTSVIAWHWRLLP